MNISSILKKLFPAPVSETNKPLTHELAASFFPKDSSRLAHMCQASRTAEKIAHQSGLDEEESQALITAALFHDVGYSETLKQTGFHPLDGAVYLAHAKASEEIIEAVLWHSSTPFDIKSFPEIEKIYAGFPVPDPASPLLAGVSYCDLRTSPTGTPFSFGQRILELEKRFGKESIPPAAARKIIPNVRAAQNSYVKRIVSTQQKPLPWIFCDIDGTLITPGEKLDPTTSEAIKRYSRAGGKISLVTGKHLISISKLLNGIGPGPHSGINGSMLLKNDSLHPYGPTIKPYNALENIFLGAGISYATYVTDGIWTKSGLTEKELASFILVGERLPEYGPTPEGKDVFKVLTYSDRKDRGRCDFVRKVAAEHELGCVRTAESFLEICPENHGKHAAAIHIMEEAGWPDLNSISIGDSENDLSMFGITGLSAAVANAAEEVLPAADLHIPSCADKGVAKLLDALLESAKEGCWSIPKKWLSSY